MQVGVSEQRPDREMVVDERRVFSLRRLEGVFGRHDVLCQGQYRHEQTNQKDSDYIRHLFFHQSLLVNSLTLH
jgi:hypothetical protein